MNIILRKLCKTSSEDFSFIHSKSAEDYLRNFGESTSMKVDFQQTFGNLDPRIVSLLDQMLEVNPYFRPSA